MKLQQRQKLLKNRSDSHGYFTKAVLVRGGLFRISRNRNPNRVPNRSAPERNSISIWISTAISVLLRSIDASLISEELFNLSPDYMRS